MKDVDISQIEKLSEEPREEKKNPYTQSQELLELCQDIELFHNDDGGFASIPVDGHLETHFIRKKSFREWLSMTFYKKNKKPPNSQALQDAIGVLEGKAKFDSPYKPVFIRVAHVDDKVYLDLCNAAWGVTEISKSGWKILNRSPVKFLRTPGMLPLPVPTRCTQIESLRPFINIETESDWCVMVGWLMFSLGGRGPYPIVALSGEQGSAKSTTASVLKKIIDPHKCLLRSMPRSDQDLMIAAKNSWIVSMDNLSNIQPWMSDAICRLAMGAASAGRTLFTDAEETILDARRPVILNGIEELATRSDLVDRCIVLELPIISEASRHPEEEFWQAFEKEHPKILGALLHSVTHGLKNINSVSRASYPRMADFAKWIVASETSLGFAPNSILDSYLENRTRANSSILEASPIFSAILQLAEHGWSGTATDLLKAITRNVPVESNERKDFPKTAQALSGAIKRIAPNLRKVGIEHTSTKTSGKNSRKIITLRKRVISSDAPDALSAKPLGPSILNPSGVACVDGVDELRPYSTEDYEERAAIIEFDSNVPRDQAETLAAKAHCFKSTNSAMKVAQPNERNEYENQ